MESFSGQTAVVVGGTSGIGRAVAETLARRGERVFITGRDAARAEAIAREIGPNVSGLALDLSQPKTAAEALKPVDRVDHLVISAIERDFNNVGDYNIDGAIRLATLKVVGYTAVVAALAGRFSPDASIVLMGGLAKDRPYPGSTTVSAVNGAVSGLVHTLAVELGPVRVNALHPGIIGDTETWSGKGDAMLDGLRARTPTGRLASTADVAGATLFLLDNRGVNGVNLPIDGGWLLK
jgi:NAD(P)-dependent dehydrogenase (short-subunit alcohol dehydrogenase family)